MTTIEQTPEAKDRQTHGFQAEVRELLQLMIHDDPRTAALLYERGRAELASADAVVAGAPTPAGPDELVALIDQILRGLFEGDFAVALDRAAAFCRVQASGATHLADDYEGTEPDRASAFTTRALRLSDYAVDLTACAALWRRDWIERTRCTMPPALTRVVIGVDPPASSKGDECGIVVAGRAESDAGFVLADLSAAGMSPNAWAARVADAFEHWKADFIVAEANQGGEMVKSVLQHACPNLPVRLVHATRSKLTRAAPIAALYEQNRIHHTAVFADLEDQMCQYDGEGESPDRMDALVWALTDLFGVKRTEPKIRSF